MSVPVLSWLFVAPGAAEAFCDLPRRARGGPPSPRSSGRPPTARHFKSQTPRPSPQSQSFSRSSLIQAESSYAIEGLSQAHARDYDSASFELSAPLKVRPLKGSLLRAGRLYLKLSMVEQKTDRHLVCELHPLATVLPVRTWLPIVSILRLLPYPRFSPRCPVNFHSQSGT